MSYVIAAPEMMTVAATDLAGIGSDLSEAHSVAAGPTVGLVPAAADEVSAVVTHLFSQHAAGYQAVAAQAAAFQGQFVQHLHAGAFSYANAEAAIAAILQTLTADVNGFVSSLANIGAIIREIFLANPGLAIAALVELPFLISFLLLTSPIWIPLALIVGPFLLVLAAA